MSLDEIAELRRRLAEAEDTIRAIRQGDVDALVVGQQGETQVFEIGGGTDAYHAFMEVMNVGAAAIDQSGRILYANANLTSALGLTQNSVQGSLISEVAPMEVAEAVDHLLVPPLLGPLSTQVDFKRDGETVHYILAATPFQLSTTPAVAITFTDVTDRVRAEATEQSERAARAVIASANEAVLVCDRDGIITHANAAAHALFNGDPLGMEFAQAVPLQLPNATGLMQAEDIVFMAIQGTAVQGVEAHAPNAPKVKDFLVSAAPLRIGNDAISGCVVTMVDLSQRKEAEKQQLLLMRELDHRVKNTLALVLSISSRTLHHEDTLEGFQKAFTGRIEALAATHNLLAENSWTNLKIDDVVQSELAPFTSGVAGRLVTRDLDRLMAPRAAIAFGLVVHELATNAAKYGALSVTGGRVSVQSVPQPDGEGRFVVEWRESGGPRVEPPVRKGFGHTVIARSLQYSPTGGAEIAFEPEGLVCRISLPIEDLHN
ncbi:sensor histidine kinase [Consotaella salsifontis]|uniref:Blue-light-activated histidine kinase n=1 Tax=Consotaella salsifontis TaxID=1365950 RepID=A0A1T4T1Z0_9HYPH|nr:HWE histidine kinase domain-containing protein [Consotaella salsifontis]SKA34432.1 PAS domain S-box-containing protein [Consotaella salsifontis]